MIHEFKDILIAYQKGLSQGLKAVLATIVHVEGSSYRKPGARMLVMDNDEVTGVISGGCIEKEVMRNAQSVFEDGRAVVMIYDGRYRAGCEGVVYVLIEGFSPSLTAIETFNSNWNTRDFLTFDTYFVKEESKSEYLGTNMLFSDGKTFSLSGSLKSKVDGSLVFRDRLSPCFQLFVIGAERDAVYLSQFAAQLGWEVTIVSPPGIKKTPGDFIGAKRVVYWTEDELAHAKFDDQTAVILMSHNFARDLKFLLSIKELPTLPLYIGILGAVKRRERMLSELLQHDCDPSMAFLELIHGPAGLSIGAKTPQEIAISITSEIIALKNSRKEKGPNEKTFVAEAMSRA